MDDHISSRVLVKHCTVRLLIQGMVKGTGFFVAPGLVLTCAHVVAEALERQIPVEVHTWDGQQLGQTFIETQKTFIEEIPIQGTYPRRTHKYPDLALLHIERNDLPCVYLDDSIGAREPLFSYGYVQDYPSGDEAEFTYEGKSWIDSQRWLLKFSEGQVAHGLSGGPLLNLRTGAVCGVVQRKRGSEGELGGRAIPVQTICACFPELSALQQQFHQVDRRWLASLSPSQLQLLQPSPVSSTPPLTESAPTVQASIQISLGCGARTTPGEIAQSLLRRKHISVSTVLLLGARCGGLYDNDTLYAEIQKAITYKHAFEKLSNAEKFEECYKVLKNQTKSTIHDILRFSLSNALQGRDEDERAAKLTHQGYFDGVVSTNIDVLLDRAVERERLLDPRFDPRLVVFDGKNSSMLIREERRRSKISKIFGNLDAGQGYYYTVGNELEFDNPRYLQLKEHLQNVLLENLVVVGYDPTWDRPLERLFLERAGGDIFYINEGPPAEHSLLARVIQRRQGKCLLGEEGRYQVFMTQLSRGLASDV